MNRDIFTQWEQVERIPFGRMIPEDIESISFFVEEPLQEAVGIMFNKNVPTVGSSCNINDYMRGHAWITVDYEFMTARNRKVVDRYENADKFELFNRNIGKVVIVAGLLFPIEEGDLPSDIGHRAVELAGRFYNQPNFLPKNI